MRRDGWDGCDLGTRSLQAPDESEHVVGQAFTIACLNTVIDTRRLSVRHHDIHRAVVFLVGLGQGLIVMNCGSDTKPAYEAEATRFAHLLSLRIHQWWSKQLSVSSR